MASRAEKYQEAAARATEHEEWAREPLGDVQSSRHPETCVILHALLAVSSRLEALAIATAPPVEPEQPPKPRMGSIGTAP